ncbi:hypothetical protein Pcaca05_29200 [Pectobacterium carotovorum subsp. carotovorum]|nr:hypothetical protein Pcaca05_29200 [Pectobacterium carotovorum subsp. carotovorum]
MTGTDTLYNVIQGIFYLAAIAGDGLEVMMFGNLGKAGKYLGQAARMLVGMPDYDTYVQHMQTNHPDKPAMTYEEFFRERQQARYGGDGKGGMRCC